MRRKFRLIGLFLLGIAAGLVVTFYQLRLHRVSLAPPKSHTIHASITPAPPTTEFAFYALLPKMEVPVTPATNTPAPLTPPSSTKAGYWLQVASFKGQTDALRFKTRLTQLGFPTATLKTYHHSPSAVWTRVMMGPYPSQDQAKTAQEALHQQGFDSLLLKNKG